MKLLLKMNYVPYIMKITRYWVWILNLNINTCYNHLLWLVWFGLWCLMPLSTINISVISWQSILLMEEAEVPGENHWPAVSHWQTLLSHNVVSSTRRLSGIQAHYFSGDRHWCIGSCKSNYQTITTMTSPFHDIQWDISHKCLNKFMNEFKLWERLGCQCLTPLEFKLWHAMRH